jgi:hypothetical protein
MGKSSYDTLCDTQARNRFALHLMTLPRFSGNFYVIITILISKINIAKVDQLALQIY